MTIGTNIMRASFSLTSHTPARKFRMMGGLEIFSLSRLTIQEIEGLFVADPVPDSIQRSITCQSSADRIGRLVCLCRQCFYLAVDFVVADFNLFFIGDFFQQQRGLHLLDSLSVLACAQTGQVHFLHVLGAHTLSCKSAKPAFEADIYLMIHERFGNLELVAPDEFSQQFVLGLALGGLAAFLFHAFANTISHLSASSKFAEFLGEIIVQLR